MNKWDPGDWAVLSLSVAAAIIAVVAVVSACLKDLGFEF